MNIYHQLEGPILDVLERHYRAHNHVLGLSKPALDKGAYWELKRRHESVGRICALSGCPKADRFHYEQNWRRFIEERKFLSCDHLVPGARDTLQASAQHHQLVLLALRQNPENLDWQLDFLGLKPYLVKVLYADSGQTPSWWLEEELILKSGIFRGERGLMVVNTEDDMVAGRHLRLTTVAVLNGLRDRERLSYAEPDFYLDDITQLPPFISQVVSGAHH